MINKADDEGLLAKAAEIAGEVERLSQVRCAVSCFLDRKHPQQEREV